MKLLLLVLILLSASGAGSADQPFSVHRVADGDTLAAIAGRYGAAPGDIASARAGRSEKLPPPEQSCLFRIDGARAFNPLRDEAERAWRLAQTPGGRGIPRASGASPFREQQTGAPLLPPRKEIRPKSGKSWRRIRRRKIYCQGRGHSFPYREKRGHFPCRSDGANGLREGSVIRPGDVLVLRRRKPERRNPGQRNRRSPLLPRPKEPPSTPWPLRAGLRRAEPSAGRGFSNRHRQEHRSMPRPRGQSSTAAG